MMDTLYKFCLNRFTFLGPHALLDLDYRALSELGLLVHEHVKTVYLRLLTDATF